MSDKKCPNCKAKIEHMEVSKQIEGSQRISCVDKIEPLHPIVWKEEQNEPIIYNCPLCHTEIDDKTLKEWGVK
jgi:hypothetical protein